MKKLFAAAAIVLSLIGSAGASDLNEVNTSIDAERTIDVEETIQTAVILVRAHTLCGIKILKDDELSLPLTALRMLFGKEAIIAQAKIVYASIDKLGAARWCYNVVDHYKQRGLID